MSSSSWNYQDFVEFELKHLERTQSVLINPILAHYKLKQWIFKTKHLTQMARQLKQTDTLDPKAWDSYEEADKADNAERRSRCKKFTRMNKHKNAHERTLINVGDCKISGNLPMRGYVRTYLKFPTRIRHQSNSFPRHRRSYLCLVNCWLHWKIYMQVICSIGLSATRAVIS